MPFYFRLRFKFPHEVKNKGEAQIIIDTVRLNSRLPDYYDGQTVEMIDEPKGWIGSAISMLRGK